MFSNQKNSLNKLILSLMIVLLSACQSIPSAPILTNAGINPKQCVVLVHGLWRSGWAMRSIAKDLEEYAYHTVSISYPSTSMTIPEIADTYMPPAIEECKKNGAEQIHIVSHSMGGIVVRQYLQTHNLPEGSKVVMLSPPNQGSELSDKFGEESWYQFFVGPAGSSLSNNEGGIIPTLKKVNASVGVIAGYRDWSVWPSSWLPEPNDGTVSVESMKLAEMDDFVLVNSGHAMMRFHADTHEQIRYFLTQGSFYHADKPDPYKLNKEVIY